MTIGSEPSTAAARPARIGDLLRIYEPPWVINGRRGGYGYVAWRRGTRGTGAIEADTAAGLAEQLAAAEAAI
jgi:hypothetical protein